MICHISVKCQTGIFVHVSCVICYEKLITEYVLNLQSYEHSFTFFIFQQAIKSNVTSCSKCLSFYIFNFNTWHLKRESIGIRRLSCIVMLSWIYWTMVFLWHFQSVVLLFCSEFTETMLVSDRWFLKHLHAVSFFFFGSVSPRAGILLAISCTINAHGFSVHMPISNFNGCKNKV